MTTALAILIEGRRRLEDPDRWGKGMRADRDDDTTCCAVEAIEDQRANYVARVDAICALLTASSGACDNRTSLPQWNDAPERTHAQVLALYDKAIAAERAKG